MLAAVKMTNLTDILCEFIAFNVIFCCLFAIKIQFDTVSVVMHPGIIFERKFSRGFSLAFNLTLTTTVRH